MEEVALEFDEGNAVLIYFPSRSSEVADGRGPLRRLYLALRLRKAEARVEEEEEVKRRRWDLGLWSRWWRARDEAAVAMVAAGESCGLWPVVAEKDKDENPQRRAPPKLRSVTA